MISSVEFLLYNLKYIIYNIWYLVYNRWYIVYNRSYIIEMKYIESKRSNRKYEYLYNVL